MTDAPRLVLHEDPRSGNCYKIRLTAALVGATIERRGYDILKRETRTPEFLATVNPNGRIPVLQIGDRYLPESNAACFWLADGSALIPASRDDRADMLRWMFWEQYNHEPNVATLRFLRRFIGSAAWSPAQAASVPAKMAGGEAALAELDRHLHVHAWLTGEGLTLADICLYAYTRVAGEGGFEMADYPAIGRWLAAVEATPGYVPMSA